MTDSSTETSEKPSGFRFGLFAPLLIFGVMAVVFFFALQNSEPNKLPSVLIGKPVPSFNLAAVEGLVVDGKPVPGFSDADLKKGEVSIVNVWASWCVPCRQEHPHLTTLVEKSKAPMYGLNYKDNPENSRRFLGQLGSSYAKVGADTNGRAAIHWGVYGVPETFIVDGKGRIAYKHVGPVTPEIVDKVLVPKIQELRNAK